ncbi:ATP-binding protein [Aeromonas hydrophila]|uniref:ATP-binding protein n=1 Tax=Aeromonas hydrophila TaxID=644 RepID=UPI003986B19C
MEALEASILASVNSLEPLDILRQDIEDALKEYSIDDLMVELLQNSLDAIDYVRYEEICALGSLNGSDNNIIERWNKCVKNSIEKDFIIYSKCKDQIEKASYYKDAISSDIRKNSWLEILASDFLCSSEVNIISRLKEIYSRKFQISISIDRVDNDGVWIEVEDDGIGMPDIIKSFTHKFSSKRNNFKKMKRCGERGSHGWGLSSVLGMSNKIEVISSHKNNTNSFSFLNYKSFVKGDINSPSNNKLLLESHDINGFSKKILQGENGTHIRVKIDNFENNAVFGELLSNFDVEKCKNYLRMYTPIGQVNDYVAHPAYHVVRENDVRISLTTKKNNAIESHVEVPFSHYSLANSLKDQYLTYAAFINTASRANTSVHTIHRAKKGEDYYLSAADIQSADLVKELVEKPLRESNHMPGYMDPNNLFVGNINRGFQFALSGGMKSEFYALPPSRNVAAFRGVILSETAKPTLGRKHVMDQRNSIPRAAQEHVNVYENERQDTLPKATPKPSSAKEHKWRREQIEQTIKELKSQPIITDSLNIWSGKESLEAKVMLVFGELLGLGIINNIKVLRCHLNDKYDFYYLSEINKSNIPVCGYLQTLQNSGNADINENDDYYVYGIGEFKYKGDSVLKEFDQKDPRKSPNVIDLLVCWEFDVSDVTAQGWSSDVVNDQNRVHPAQTHSWKSVEKSLRDRELAVISLSKLILDKTGNDKDLSPLKKKWDNHFPETYY